LATTGVSLITLAAGNPALAQKQGGVLRLLHFESTRAAEQPMMHVFNNLIMYKQEVAQTSLQSIVPDLPRTGRGVRTGWS
jgi:peptide/nickel transport system substrate-binding protein